MIDYDQVKLDRTAREALSFIVKSDCAKDFTIEIISIIITRMAYLAMATAESVNNKDNRH